VITVEELREKLIYAPDTGIFTWRIGCPWKKYAVGDVVGCYDGKRHWKIHINGRGYNAHRLAWLYVHGRWPPQYIDHINGDGCDNRLVNLRESTPRQNQANKRLSKPPKSGFIGVFRNPCDRTWKARLRVDGKIKYLGSFATAELASAAYLAAHRAAHQEFSGIGLKEKPGSNRANGLPGI
jgi:hypothetical protein